MGVGGVGSWQLVTLDALLWYCSVESGHLTPCCGIVACVMARAIRVEFEGAVYHVTARGNERKPIYRDDRDDRDRERFLETLEETVKRFGL